MKKYLILLIMILYPTIICAQENPELKELKRPAYNFSERIFGNSTQSAQKKNLTSVKPKEQIVGFAGKYEGTVTVHYEGEVVETGAILTVSTSADVQNSHYDYYVLPSDSNFSEYDWNLDGQKVHRSVTVSLNTVYVTDIIKYKRGGGNSQIRTLVFADDKSALTFLKTEFDDSRINPATGQIIGRFARTE